MFSCHALDLMVDIRCDHQFTSFLAVFAEGMFREPCVPDLSPVLIVSTLARATAYSLDLPGVLWAAASLNEFATAGGVAEVFHYRYSFGDPI